jgi:hypothetical protein
MPKPTRPSPRIQAERLEPREVFSAGLDPTFGTAGIVDDVGYRGPGVTEAHTDLFVGADGTIRVGAIDDSGGDRVEIFRVDPAGVTKYPAVRIDLDAGETARGTPSSAATRPPATWTRRSEPAARSSSTTATRRSRATTTRTTSPWHPAGTS